MRLRRSLFLKIYATVLGALLFLALASAGFVRLGQNEQDRGWAAERDRFIAAMLPPNAPPSELQFLIDRFASALRAHITVYDPDGRPIASNGPPLPFNPQDRNRRRDRDGPRDRFTTQLPDGRYISARLENPFRPSLGWPLAYLALVALVTGAAAYPVVRHLTRRLERLRGGMAEWGAGALSTRVPVSGGDEIADVAASFNQAAERVEQLVASHRSLLANASHELRSPLARLRMATELELPENDVRRTEILLNLAELDTLVEEILLASRLDNGAPQMVRETVDLLPLAAEEAARNGLSAEGVSAAVSGDPKLLTRLVRNLIQNAQRHGAPPIEIAVARSDGLAVLSIRDHGPGISEAEGQRIFEPFYRPVGRGESAGGWGLGLALVQQIAVRHGGSVRLERPADGKGACFVVTLPLAG